MSFDRPGGPGDRDPDDIPPFPGAPADREPAGKAVPSPSLEQMRAAYARSSTIDELIANAKADEAAAAKGAAAEAPADKAIVVDQDDDAETESELDGIIEGAPKAEPKPDASPDEIAALRKRIADQDAEIANLKVNDAAQAAEIAGLRTQLSERKAADVERDWKDRARDDKIADQAKDIEDLKTALKERTDKRPDADDDKPSTTIAERTKTDPPRSHERRFHLPSNTKMSLFSSIIGEAAAADHVPTHTSDYVSVGVATVSLGVSAVAAWREHRKNGRDDTDNRPRG